MRVKLLQLKENPLLPYEELMRKEGEEYAEDGDIAPPRPSNIGLKEDARAEEARDPMLDFIHIYHVIVPN